MGHQLMTWLSDISLEILTEVFNLFRQKEIILNNFLNRQHRYVQKKAAKILSQGKISR